MNSSTETYFPVRIFFKKKDRAKYISHLDINRCFARAIKRSCLPVWYTQGFNPHLYMTFALPISLGFESYCESVDIRLTEDLPYEQVVETLNRVLPHGIEVYKAAPPILKPENIRCAVYHIELVYKNSPKRVLKLYEEFVKQKMIVATKKSKKGDTVIDLKSLFYTLATSLTKESLIIDLRVAAGINLNINPNLIINTFVEYSSMPYLSCSILRRRILTEMLGDFI